METVALNGDVRLGTPLLLFEQAVDGAVPIAQVVMSNISGLSTVENPLVLV